MNRQLSFAQSEYAGKKKFIMPYPPYTGAFFLGFGVLLMVNSLIRKRAWKELERNA